MTLSQGDTAPDFTLYDDEKNAWTLSEHEGEKVVLLFFPGAFTSVCTTELNTVSNDIGSYEDLGATVVGISTDSPFVQAEFKKVHDFRFPLLSDHDAEVAARYGAKYDGDFTDMNLDRIARRAAFVIDEEGKIAYAEILDSAGDLPDFDAILDTLDG